jgi:hypothetical protein
MKSLPELKCPECGARKFDRVSDVHVTDCLNIDKHGRPDLLCDYGYDVRDSHIMCGGCKARVCESNDLYKTLLALFTE